LEKIPLVAQRDTILTWLCNLMAQQNFVVN
jgi:hypothetical protein